MGISKFSGTYISVIIHEISEIYLRVITLIDVMALNSLDSLIDLLRRVKGWARPWLLHDCIVTSSLVVRVIRVLLEIQKAQEAECPL